MVPALLTGSSKGHRGRKVHSTQPHTVLKARGNLMLNYAGSSLTGSRLLIGLFFFFNFLELIINNPSRLKN